MEKIGCDFCEWDTITGTKGTILVHEQCCTREITNMKNKRALGGQNKTVFMKMAAATSVAIGPEFKAETFRLAFAKAKRWAVNAYGTADMSEYAGENGYELITFYNECVAKVKNTFNWENYQNRNK